MSFSSFFSEQARKPKGLFGRMVMSRIFDFGNAFLNVFVCELMSVQSDDRILEIGCGTGKLISRMARQMSRGFIEGIDFSNEMVSIARRRNKKNIAKGKVEILEGNFDEMPHEKEKFSKVCSVNTLYFWPVPAHTATITARILQPGGKLFLAFEDMEQLKQRKLDHEIFTIYSQEEVVDILVKAGYSHDVRILSKQKGNLIFHCAVATK
jgi:ubiquinone/menaquinone biosynthesis C-methylase UbiE